MTDSYWRELLQIQTVPASRHLKMTVRMMVVTWVVSAKSGWSASRDPVCCRTSRTSCTSTRMMDRFSRLHNGLPCSQHQVSEQTERPRTHAFSNVFVVSHNSNLSSTWWSSQHRLPGYPSSRAIRQIRIRCSECGNWCRPNVSIVSFILTRKLYESMWWSCSVRPASWFSYWYGQN